MKRLWLAIGLCAFIVALCNSQSTQSAGSGLHTKIITNLLDDGVETGIITPRQRDDLLHLAPKHIPIHQPPVSAEEQIHQEDDPPQEKSGPSLIQATQDLTFKTFGYVKDGLTILNVLYFAGGLLIMGSMSIFVTVGFAQFGHAGLVFIGVSYICGFHTAAHIIWYSYESYRLLAGMFATISVAICPFVLFSVMKLMGFFRNGPYGEYTSFHRFIGSTFLLLELGTGVFGCLTLITIPFPFITMPISFCAWYATMDLTEFIYGRRGFNWKERARVSVVSGACIILVAFLVEHFLNPSTDFSFWIYNFGLIAFWGGLINSGEGSSLGTFLFILIQSGLIVLSHPMLLDRYMFAFWGLWGYLAAYTRFTEHYTHRTMEPFWLVMYFVPPMLLIFSTGTFSGSPIVVSFFSTEAAAFIAGVYSLGVCQVIFQIWVVHSTWFSFRILYFYFFMGILSNLELFQLNILVPVLESYLGWTIPGWIFIAIISVACCISYFTPTAPGWMGVQSLSQKFDLLVALWLILYNGAILSSLDVSTAFFSRVGMIVIGFVAFVIHGFLKSMEDGLTKELTAFFYFSVAAAASLWYLESVVIFFIPFYGFIRLSKVTHWTESSKILRRIFIGILLITLSIALNSKMLITLGAITEFFCLMELSHRIFRDSLLFPIAVTFLGFWVIGIGFLYQRYYENIQMAAEYISSLDTVTPVIRDVMKIPSSKIDESFHWFAPLSNLLYQNQMYLLTFSAALLVLIALACVMKIFMPKGKSALPSGSPGHIKITSKEITLNTSKKDHGFAIKLKGTKPEQLTIRQAWLYIDDSSIWHNLERVVPAIAVQVFKSSMYPIKMCPVMLKKEDFKAGSRTFETTIEFAVGTNGGPSVSHPTLMPVLRNLEYNNITQLGVRVVFETEADLRSRHTIRSKSGLMGLYGRPIYIGNLCSVVIHPRTIYQCKN